MVGAAILIFLLFAAVIVGAVFALDSFRPSCSFVHLTRRRVAIPLA
jgi:hypothetical protein